MNIKDVVLSNFRIYREEKKFEFSEDVTGIVGENAHGKTTILEAVYMMCRGKGFREREEYELLTFGEENGHIIGSFEDEKEEIFERAIMYKRVKIGEEEYKLEKKYYLEKAPVGAIRYSRSNPPVVLFAPQHIDIIVHGPSYRREYINSVISAKVAEYAKALREYEAVLRRRNALLENYIDKSTLRHDLAHWDELLIENAQIIQSNREKYLDYLHADHSCAGKRFRVIYKSSRLSSGRLDELFEKEAAARRTLAGPQKDDLEIQIEVSNDKYVSVHAYASRSQQRLAILWLKMRELDYLALDNGTPLLLLDDVYSEFDSVYRKIVTSIIPNYQTIVTATDEISIPQDVARNMKIIRV